MADRLRTAAELEAMSPAEQDALFDSSIVTDLDEADGGAEGEPSTNDFQVFELLRIVERFAGLVR